jgi:hypothetical protein
MLLPKDDIRAPARRFDAIRNLDAAGGLYGPMMRTRVLALVVTICAAGVAMTPQPVAAREVQKAIWFSPPTNGVSEFPTYSELGVKIVELGLNWSEIAPTRPSDPTNPNDPAYRWPADADSVSQQTQMFGMQELLMVSQTPEWANGGQDPRYPPTATADYTDFLVAASRRYPAVRLWLIWSEACSHNQFLPITPQAFGKPVTPQARVQPQAYATLLDASYTTLKQLDPRNVVIGGSTWAACDIRPIDWAHYLKLPGGGRPRMDLWANNPYIVINPKQVPKAWKVSDIYGLPRLQAAIDHYFGRKPRIGLFLSEFMVPTRPDREFPIYTSERGQAKYTRDAFQISRKLGTVTALGWLHLYDRPPPPGQTEGSTGGLLRQDGTKKPAFYVFRRE